MFWSRAPKDNKKSLKSTHKKYRIAYLTHGMRNIGGGEYVLFFLIKNLNRDIFEPMVFYSHENEIIIKLRQDGFQMVQIPLNEKITSVYRDKIHMNPISILVYFRYLLSGVFQIIKLLRNYNIDILHPHDNLSKIMGGLAVKLTGGKVVAHCHDLLQESLVDRLLLFYQLIFMDRIIAVSDSVKGLFMVFGKTPDKVCTIPNGIDMNNFNNVVKRDLKKELGINNEDTVIGIIAVFDTCKGHVYLFRAIKKLVSGGMNSIVCLVIGDGRTGDELRAFVKREGLNQHIRFLGYRNDVPELLSVMDILTIPSLQESFGMAALEAMAMKVPVIATMVGGLPEIVDEGKTGMLIPPADVDALYKALKYLIQNRALRKRMGEAGREKVRERFSAITNVRKTERVYLDVLQADEKV